jgi:hypothetical protein
MPQTHCSVTVNIPRFPLRWKKGDRIIRFIAYFARDLSLKRQME